MAHVMVLALLAVCFCAIIDPFNVMHVFAIRTNGVEPNKNFIKMTYVKENPDKFDSFLMGSSRVGSIHVENIPDAHCYNMTYSEGLPAEHLDNIKSFLDAGIVPRRIYMGVDSHSYTILPETHFEEGIRSSYEYLRAHKWNFAKLYWDPAVVITSPAFKNLLSGNVSIRTEDDSFYKYGWSTDYGQTAVYNFAGEEPNIGDAKDIERTLQTMRDIADLCRNNGIELILFTNPMYSVTYEAALERDYLVFLEGLASIAPFYNFSGYNQISTDSSNWLDTSHYKAEIGDLMIDCMCSGARYDHLYKDGFGMYIDESNIGALIELLSAQQPT